jgi:hypothetical protein
MRQTEDATDLTEVWVDVDSGEDCAITKPELLSEADRAETLHRIGRMMGKIPEQFPGPH